jgi:hypothetical protein
LAGTRCLLAILQKAPKIGLVRRYKDGGAQREEGGKRERDRKIQGLREKQRVTR